MKSNKNKFDGINFLILKEGKSDKQLVEEIKRILKIIEEGKNKESFHNFPEDKQ